MKTRTLLLLSVACGLLIMVAGAVLLLQLSSQDEALPPLAPGERAEVGDMSVTALGADEAGGEVAVRVAIGGAPDPAPAEDFRLIASGRPAPLAHSTCPPIEPDEANGTGDPGGRGEVVGTDEWNCVVTFDVSAADGSSRVLVYERGEERARWQLDP